MTTAPATELDGKHVILGKLLRGSSVLDEVEKGGTTGGTPKAKVLVI